MSAMGAGSNAPIYPVIDTGLVRTPIADRIRSSREVLAHASAAVEEIAHGLEHNTIAWSAAAAQLKRLGKAMRQARGD